MGSISLPYTLTAGQPENVNQLNSNLNEIVNTVNGNLDATNLASNAVTTAKITDANVTTAKIADAGVTKAKLATDALNAFLKLNSAADVKVAFGRYNTPAFGGAIQQTGNIPHGMGVTPQVVFLFTQQGATAANPSGVPVVGSRTTVDGTNIGYLLRNADGSNSSTGTIIDWLAIG